MCHNCENFFKFLKPNWKYDLGLRERAGTLWLGKRSQVCESGDE